MRIPLIKEIIETLRSVHKIAVRAWGWSFLVTETYGVIEAGSDDASVSLNSSYCSFRGSLDLNVDLCSKNISTLEQKAHMKADLMTVRDENNLTFQDHKTTLWRHLLA